MAESCCACWVVHKKGLKVVVFLFTEYLKEKHPLKLEGDKIELSY